MFATGITVVTTIDETGMPRGLTVNSFNSVSLDPPLIVWSLDRDSELLSVFEHCEYFAVNVLAADQEALSRHFARRGAGFDGQAWTPDETGVPLLAGCCATFVLRNAVRHAGGDHLVFLGEIVRHSHHRLEPLVYFGGKYRHLAALEN